MTRTKTSTKILITLGIILLSVFLLGVNKVNAVDIPEEIKQKVESIIPDQMQLNIQEVEYEKATNLIMAEIEKLLQENNVTYNKIDMYGITGYELQGDFGGVVIPVYDYYFYSVDTFRKYEINIYANKNNMSVNHIKDIELVFNNSNKYNDTDKQIVKNLYTKPAGYYEVEIDKNIDYKEMFRIAGEYYTKQINDSSIIVKARAGAGGAEDGPLNLETYESGTYIGIFKNGILYDVRSVGNDRTIPSITIPSNVAEDKVIDYILDIIKPMYKKFIEEYNETPFDETKLKVSKGAVYKFRESVSHNQNGTLNEKWTNINIPEGYTVTYEGVGSENYIIARKEKSTSEITQTDTTTSIKLDTTTGVVPANTKLIANKVTEGKTYNTIVEALGSNVSKFVLYDISLTSNNATIQPNGKVKISIPVPNGYDTSKIVVYRIAEDGTKTKYDTTINNGYVIFETDHFSNYVVAEETITNNDTTKEPTETQKQPDNKPTTSGKLDDTPKTGADNTMSVICSIVSVLSIIGIAIIKKF